MFSLNSGLQHNSHLAPEPKTPAYSTTRNHPRSPNNIEYEVRLQEFSRYLKNQKKEKTPMKREVLQTISTPCTEMHVTSVYRRHACKN